MLTRQDFLTAFYERLRAAGFHVDIIDEGDVAAEVSDPEGNLYCAITTDGDIVYETADDDREKVFSACVRETQVRAGVCTTIPIEGAEAIGQECYKIFESNYILLAFRRSALWGYEFFTCKKAGHNHRNTRLYYHERRFFSLEAAKNDFSRRSGLSDDRPRFTPYELTLIMECCSKRLMLDNSLDAELEGEIGQLITRLEGFMPPGIAAQPRHFFEDERGPV